MNEPIFEWNEETGEASCILNDGQKSYYGLAICHEDDKDMMSEKTGLQIAYLRAKIKALCSLRDNNIMPALAAYKQLYYSMNTSKKFNPKSYENKMLQRKIREKQIDLDTVNEMLSTERKNLRQYIEEKDKFYKKIRARRLKDKNN